MRQTKEAKLIMRNFRLIFAILASLVAATLFISTLAVPYVLANSTSSISISSYEAASPVTLKELTANIPSYGTKFDILYSKITNCIEQAHERETSIANFYSEILEAKVCSKANQIFNSLTEEYEVFSDLSDEIGTYSAEFENLCSDFRMYLSCRNSQIPKGSSLHYMQSSIFLISYILKDFENKKIKVQTIYEESKQIADAVFNEYFPLLSQLVYSECGSDNITSYERYCCAKVPENRIESPDFPNTLVEVIYQEMQYAPTWDGSMPNDSSDQVKRDVEDILRGRVDLEMPDEVVFQSKRQLGKLWKYFKESGHYYCSGNI